MTVDDASPPGRCLAVSHTGQNVQPSDGLKVLLVGICEVAKTYKSMFFLSCISCLINLFVG